MNVRIEADGLDRIEVEAWGRRYLLTNGATEPVQVGGLAGARGVDEGVSGLIATCAREVAALTGVSLVHMRRSNRRQDVSRARIAAMWLAHTRYGVHETELGIFFRRHRTTVIYAIQSVATALRLDQDGAPSPHADRWLLVLPTADVARTRCRNLKDEEATPSASVNVSP